MRKFQSLKDYQTFCKSTAVYPAIGYNFNYPLIGLAGEIGELCNILKKTIRDDEGIVTEKKQSECKSELSDIAWYFVMICYELGIDPDDVLDLSYFKLTARKQNNTIHDTGKRKE